MNTYFLKTVAQSVEALIEATITMQEGKKRGAKISTILTISIVMKVTDSVSGVKKEVTFEMRIKG